MLLLTTKRQKAQSFLCVFVVHISISNDLGQSRSQIEAGEFGAPYLLQPCQRVCYHLAQPYSRHHSLQFAHCPLEGPCESHNKIGGRRCCREPDLSVLVFKLRGKWIKERILIGHFQ